MDYIAYRAPARNRLKIKTQSAAERRRAGFARKITALELGDRYVHRGVGKLTLSYFQFGERKAP
jgi:hypothetical protein